MCAFSDWSGRSEHDTPPVAGYVLAGGKSSRMGTNKALLPLAGRTLVERAVTKLERLCATVKILSNDERLRPYGPLVGDLHPGCGPMSGIEAALLDSGHDWNLILPVDMPLLSTVFLDEWLWAALHQPAGTRRLAMLSEGAVRHPALLIVHRELAPFVTEALQMQRYKLFPVLESAAASLAAAHGVTLEEVFWRAQWEDVHAPAWTGRPEAWRLQLEPRRGPEIALANLNTPEDFAAAELLIAASDA